MISTTVKKSNNLFITLKKNSDEYSNIFQKKCLTNIKTNCNTNQNSNKNIYLKISERSIKTNKIEANSTLDKFYVKELRINRTLRKEIIFNNKILKRLYTCNSKINLCHILDHLDETFKDLMRNYLKKFFIFHAHLRKMKNLKEFLSFRQCFFESIDDSSILKNNVLIQNNVIKNFCKGLLNYILIFYKDLKFQILKNSN